MLLAQGERSAAIALYERTRHALATRMGLPPSPALRALAGALREADPTRPPEPPRRGSAARQRPWSRPTCRSSSARAARAHRGGLAGAAARLPVRPAGHRQVAAGARMRARPRRLAAGRLRAERRAAAERLARARAAPAARGIAGRRSRAVDPARAGAADARTRSRASAAGHRRGASAAGRGARRRVRDAGARQLPGPRARRLAVDRQREPGPMGRDAQRRRRPALPGHLSQRPAAAGRARAHAQRDRCRRGRAHRRARPGRSGSASAGARAVGLDAGQRCSAHDCAAPPTATRSSCSRPCDISNQGLAAARSGRRLAHALRRAHRRLRRAAGRAHRARRAAGACARPGRAGARLLEAASLLGDRFDAAVLADASGLDEDGMAWPSPTRQRRSSSSRNATACASPTTSCANAWPKGWARRGAARCIAGSPTLCSARGRAGADRGAVRGRRPGGAALPWRCEAAHAAMRVHALGEALAHWQRALDDGAAGAAAAEIHLHCAELHRRSAIAPRPKPRCRVPPRLRASTATSR